MIIAFNALSITLDILSSELLWSTGLFVEGNGLYYVLGKIGFYLFMLLTMMISILPTIYLDLKQGTKYKIITLSLGAYGAYHLAYAIPQLLIYSRILRGV